MKLSLIIPAYNEEKVIGDTLKKVVAFFSKKNYSWQIIVVDDGSVDETPKIVREFIREEKRVSLIILDKNKGKGAALKKGFLKAKGKYAIFSDADLSVDINLADTFLKFLKDHDVVIASRRVKGARIAVPQPVLRETMGRFYTLLTSLIIGMNIKDYTCGFKGFKREAARKIFSNTKIDRWAYDSEVLFLAKKYGYSIKQVPVKWVNREDTRVKLGSVVFESLKDLIMVRINDLRKRYE